MVVSLFVRLELLSPLSFPTLYVLYPDSIQVGSPGPSCRPQYVGAATDRLRGCVGTVRIDNG